MAEIESIAFDFGKDTFLDDTKRLEDILCSGHWSDRTLDYEDERTLLLIRLLRVGGISVYRRGYTQKEKTPEIQQHAKEMNAFFNKQNVGGALLDIAGIFINHEYDGTKTVYNSLFIPELKIYVRLGGLPPDKLLELLEQDGCEGVMLFSDYQSEDGDAFFAFTLAMPKNAYLTELAHTRNKIFMLMSEAVRKADEKNGSVIPRIDKWSDSE